MNKTLIALAVSAAAVVTGAQANTIYDNDTTSFAISGEIDAYLSTLEGKGFSNAADNYKTDADIDLWAKIQIDARHKINDTVTAFGSFEIESGNGFGPGAGDDNEVSVDDVYFGLELNENFGFAVGEPGDYAKSVSAIIIDNTNEGYGYVDDVADRFESKGHGIAAKYSVQNLTLVADAYLAEDENLDSVYGISASYDFGGFNFGATYQDQGNRAGYDEAVNGDNSLLGFKAGYGIGGFDIAAHYVIDEIDSEDHEAIGVAASYQIEALRLYTSVGTIENKDNKPANYDDTTAYTLGADYALSSNLLAFVEYSNIDAVDFEKGAEENQTVAGVYFTF
jgi:outer membrane pore protein E/outer membrane porin protein LC